MIVHKGEQRQGCPWTEEEKETLVKMSQSGASDEEIASVLGRGVKGVQIKRLQIGLSAKDYWSAEEVNFLKNNYRKMTDKEIAQRLGRTVLAVGSRRRKDGLKKGKVLEEEINKKVSCLFWEGLSDREIAEALGRSESNIISRRHALGLVKAERDRMTRVYALYRGDVFLAAGTIDEIAQIRGVKPSTANSYRWGDAERMHVVEVEE